MRSFATRLVLSATLHRALSEWLQRGFPLDRPPQKGVFTMYTGSTFLGGESRRESGTYTLTGTKIVLTSSSGDQVLTPQEGTLVGDTLSLGSTDQPWILLRRP